MTGARTCGILYRRPRARFDPGEVDGKSYYFVSRERFEALIADDALLEYAEYVGNYYGTPLQPIREAIENGMDVVMDVEVVGALKIKKRLPEDAVLVFVTAPSFDVIRKRLVHRGDVAPGLMEERLGACALGMQPGG